MLRINRYILRQLLQSFGFFALVLVLIYWINRAVSLFDKLISDGQSMLIFVEFAILTLPGMMTIVLPFAAFAAAIYVANRLSADNEMAILRSAGYATRTLMRPFITFALLVCILQGALMHILEPKSFERLQERETQARESATARLLKEGTFISPNRDITIFINEISDKGELIGVFIHEKDEDKSERTYNAQKAYLVKTETGPQLVLINGQIKAYQGQSSEVRVTQFNDFVVNIASYLGAPTAPVRGIHITDSLTLWAGDDRGFAVQYEWAKRNYNTLLPLAAVMIAASTMLAGSFSRFGSRPHIIQAVALLIILKMLENVVIDEIRSTSSSVILFYVPVLFGIIIYLIQTLRADQPWRRPQKSGGPS
ncbi:MAG: LptF/LptG family permease [Planktomarina sp.]